MPTPENDVMSAQMIDLPQEPAPAALAVAPAWHTLALLAGILAISIHGASRFSGAQAPINRLTTYGFTAVMEVGLLAWVLFGLRLGKTSFRSVLGPFSPNIRSMALDLGIAMAFWFASLMVLGTLGLAWTGVEAAITHHSPLAHVPGQPFTPDASQQQALRVLAQLAPANRAEIAAWALLCLLVGFSEEVVFRGYLQRQLIAWARGGVVVGVLLSAAVFGAAHGYQGVRNMVLLGIFGALFSALALVRGSLRAGIVAHCWHDLIAGLTLALLKSNHLI